MRAGLLYSSENFVWQKKPDFTKKERFSDLELEYILEAMSRENGDNEKGEDNAEIYNVCGQVLDSPLQNKEEITYRQDILKDCISKPSVFREIYRICQEAEEKRKRCWNSLTSPHITTVYSSAADLLKIYMGALVGIRRILEKQNFSSEGMRNFSDLLCSELSDEYLDELKSLEYEISENDSDLMSAGFGAFLQGVSYTKCQRSRGLASLHWLMLPSYTIADKDMKGAKDLEIRRERALNDAADSMAKAAENLEGFVNQLRRETAFYVGAVNLYERLTQINLPVCFPSFSGEEKRIWCNLCDASLGLMTEKSVVGNDLETDGEIFYLITGANQGGKTTFLRSVGQCQLMAQCGLFVCADKCELPVKKCIFTHFKREEDSSMKSGRLSEELERMSRIVVVLKPGGMLLSNESFSSTNDFEGSEILGQITDALLERNIEVFAVTHLINYSMSYSRNEHALCLIAERKETGERTFRMIPGKPMKTAYGEDIFKRVFSEK